MVLESTEGAHARALDLLARALGDGETRARLRVKGDCMKPLVCDGDWVSVVSCAQAERGDIVVACDPSRAGALVCHRVLDRSGDAYLLCGDRTLDAREHPHDAVLGRVLAVEREGVITPVALVSPKLEGWLAAWHPRSIALAAGSTARRISELGRHLMLGARAWWLRSAKNSVEKRRYRHAIATRH